MTNGDPESVLRIGSGLWRFWQSRGNSGEGRTWLARAFTADGPTSDAALADAHIAAGELAEDQNDLAAAGRHYQQALTIAQRTGVLSQSAKALDGMGNVAQDRGEYPRAIELHLQSEHLAREAGDARLVAVAVANRGAVAYHQGDYEQAEACWMECRRIVGDQGDLVGQALMTGNLGVLALDQGDLDRAADLQTEALALQRRSGNQRGAAIALINLGEVRQRQGRMNDAAELYEEARPIFQSIGDNRLLAQLRLSLARLRHTEGDLARAAVEFAESAWALHEAGDPLGRTESIDLLACVAADLGEAETAVRFFGAAATAFAALDATRRPSDEESHMRAIAATRTALGTIGFDAMWTAGSALDVGLVIAEATALAERIATINPSVPSPLRASATHRESTAALTTREHQVLQLVVDGYSSREIADALFISPRTATTHIGHIYDKLEVGNRATAVAVALRRGLV